MTNFHPHRAAESRKPSQRLARSSQDTVPVDSGLGIDARLRCSLITILAMSGALSGVKIPPHAGMESRSPGTSYPTDLVPAAAASETIKPHPSLREVTIIDQAEAILSHRSLKGTLPSTSTPPIKEALLLTDSSSGPSPTIHSLASGTSSRIVLKASKA